MLPRKSRKYINESKGGHEKTTDEKTHRAYCMFKNCVRKFRVGLQLFLMVTTNHQPFTTPFVYCARDSKIENNTHIWLNRYLKKDNYVLSGRKGFGISLSS